MEALLSDSRGVMFELVNHPFRGPRIELYQETFEQSQESYFEGLRQLGVLMDLA
jgi:hypothetical protein